MAVGAEAVPAVPSVPAEGDPVDGGGNHGFSHGSGHDGLVDLSWVDGVAGALHYSVESVVVVGGIMYHAMSTIGVNHRVRTLDDVPITALVLGLDVSGVVVLHSVTEVVLGVGLQNDQLETLTLLLLLTHVLLDGDGFDGDGGGVHHGSGVDHRSGMDCQGGGVDGGTGVVTAERQSRVGAGDSVGSYADSM